MKNACSTALASLVAWLGFPGLLAAVLACCAAFVGTAFGAGDAVAAGNNVTATAMQSPASQPTPTRRHRTVYTCREQGVTVLSDRPCGPLPTSRSVTTEEPPQGAAATTAPPTPRASIRPRIEPAHDARPDRASANRCAALRGELAEVDDQMRAGYTAREAARLWDRWRNLKDRLHRERC